MPMLRRLPSAKGKVRYIDDDDEDDDDIEEDTEVWTRSAAADGASTSTAHLKNKTPKRSKKKVKDNLCEPFSDNPGSDGDIKVSGSETDRDNASENDNNEALSGDEKEEIPKPRGKRAPPKSKAVPLTIKVTVPAKSAPVRKLPGRATPAASAPVSPSSAPIAERRNVAPSPSIGSGGPVRRVGLSKSSKIRAMSPVRIPVTSPKSS